MHLISLIFRDSVSGCEERARGKRQVVIGSIGPAAHHRPGTPFSFLLCWPLFILSGPLLIIDLKPMRDRQLVLWDCAQNSPCGPGVQAVTALDARLVGSAALPGLRSRVLVVELDRA